MITWLKKKFKTLDALNEMYQLGFNKFEEIKLPAVPPEDNITQAKDWQDFIKTINPENTGLNRTAVSEYRDLIARKYKKESDKVALKFLCGVNFTFRLRNNKAFDCIQAGDHQQTRNSFLCCLSGLSGSLDRSQKTLSGIHQPAAVGINQSHCKAGNSGS